jgi:methylated-DNA-[protein]-cysteine S-methyltransferase
MTMRYKHIDVPFGKLLLVGEEALEIVGFPHGKMAIDVGEGWSHDKTAFLDAAEQLQAYFAGELEKFSVLMKPSGTEFQKDVLQALMSIPFGETRSYKDVAAMIGRPKSVRAVGAANGRNPLPIIIPCHRVIGADGSLTGFGGGVAVKAYLLKLEAGGKKSALEQVGFDFLRAP